MSTQAYDPRHLGESQQLLRLRQLREQQAFLALQRSEQALLRAHAQREATVLTLQQLKERRVALSHAVVTHLAQQLGRLSGYVSAAHADLDDQLERVEDSLLNDEEACESAQEARNEARQRWLAASGRRDTATGLVTDARKARRQHAERLADREDPVKTRPFWGDIHAN